MIMPVVDSSLKNNSLEKYQLFLTGSPHASTYLNLNEHLEKEAKRAGTLQHGQQ